MNIVTWARVSSYDQAKGYSLDKQARDISDKVVKEGWIVDRAFQVTESAKRADDRKLFREMIEYVKTNRRSAGGKVDGLLAHKLDRLVRNPTDSLLLEELEQSGLRIVFCEETYESSAAGRLHFRMMASVASFHSDRLREETRKGMDERAAQGWHSGLAPYGYLNREVNKEHVIVIDPARVQTMQTIFELYATGRFTLDSLCDHMYALGFRYKDTTPHFDRSKLHDWLTNPFYIGRFRRHGADCPGNHPAIVSKSTFDAVKRVLGREGYKDHDLPYAGRLITCGWCGSAVTGERKGKTLKNGDERIYDYYRCAHYNDRARHPCKPSMLRIGSADLEALFLEHLTAVRVDDDEIVDWLREILLETHEQQRTFHNGQIASLTRQRTALKNQSDKAVRGYLLGLLDDAQLTEATRAVKQEQEDVEAQLAEHTRAGETFTHLAVRVIELCQTLPKAWVAAEPPVKRELLGILWLNCQWDGVTLVPTWNKPFDLLAEGLVSGSGSGGRI